MNLWDPLGYVPTSQNYPGLTTQQRCLGIKRFANSTAVLPLEGPPGSEMKPATVWEAAQHASLPALPEDFTRSITVKEWKRNCRKQCDACECWAAFKAAKSPRCSGVICCSLILPLKRNSAGRRLDSCKELLLSIICSCGSNHSPFPVWRLLLQSGQNEPSENDGLCDVCLSL